MIIKTKIPTNSILRTVFFVQVFSMGMMAHAESGYTVRQKQRDSSVLEITYTPPLSNGVSFRKLRARGVEWGLQDQVELPHCETSTAPLKKDGDGDWILPPDCQRVIWTITPPSIRDGTYDASTQASASINQGNIILLSEPTSLLRMREADTPNSVLRPTSSSTKLLGATPRDIGGWQIPGENNAPEFFVVGTPEVVDQDIGDFTVRYVADDWRRVRNLGLMSSHAKVLRYLTRVVYADTQVPEKDQSLLVVWIGIDAQKGHAGGAAGSRSFLANYLINDEKEAPDHLAPTLMILAHEQFHQLTDALRGNRPGLPTWINESIAQYYGLRAMQYASPKSATAEKLIQHFIDPSRSIKNRFVGEVLDRNQLGTLAYSQGATFWAELDRALHTLSGGSTDLEKHIPELLKMNFPQDGSLPPAFLAQLSRWDDGRIEQLIEKYVGNARSSSGG